MVPVRAACLALCVVWTGCSVGITSGPTVDGLARAHVQSRLQMDTTRVRSSGLTAGWALTTSHAVESPVRVHSVRGRFGYGHQPRASRFSARGLYEIGLGEPTRVRFDSPGLVTGLYGDVGLRLTGAAPAVDHYYLARGTLDLFFGLHAGLWASPRGDDNHPLIEWGCLLGLRYEVSSDLFGHTRDR